MKFSVLINNFNNAPHLAACLESVYAQTRRADEIIVYDDGSTDDSLAYLRTQAGRIRLIEGVHDFSRSSMHSQANAIHQSVLAASGDWVCLLDGDDFFMPEKLAVMEAAIASDPTGVLFQSSMRYCDSEGQDQGVYRDARYHRKNYAGLVPVLHDCDFFYPTSSLVFRREFLLKVLPLDFSISARMAADTRLGIQALFYGTVVTIDQPLVSWRQRNWSMSASQSSSRWYMLRQTLRRAALYNVSAREHGASPVRVYRNPRFYRQFLGALLPTRLRASLRLRLQRWAETRCVPIAGEKIGQP